MWRWPIIGKPWGPGGSLWRRYCGGVVVRRMWMNQKMAARRGNKVRNEAADIFGVW